MKRRLRSLAGVASLTLAVALAFPGAAGAALIDRGGGLIYDTAQDITWLQNANLGAGSAFDDGASSTDGRMTWQNAVDWADALVFGGFDDWRLPLTPQPDPSCSSQSGFFPGFPDQGNGSGCTGSEMGHLAEVDGISVSLPGIPIPQGPFINVQAGDYWSGSEFAPIPSKAWYFNFFISIQDSQSKGDELFAWAVRPGDVLAQGVPEPGTAALLAAALGLLGWRARVRQRRSVIRSIG